MKRVGMGALLTVAACVGDPCPPLQAAIDNLNTAAAPCLNGGNLYAFNSQNCEAVFQSAACWSSDLSLYEGSATNINACLGVVGTCSPEDAGAWFDAEAACDVGDAGAAPACEALFSSYVLPAENP